MLKQKCPKCEKVIDGYSQKHIEYLMMQHDLTHRKKEKEELSDNTKEDETD